MGKADIYFPLLSGRLFTCLNAQQLTEIFSIGALLFPLDFPFNLPTVDEKRLIYSISGVLYTEIVFSSN